MIENILPRSLFYKASRELEVGLVKDGAGRAGRRRVDMVALVRWLRELVT
jgi:hypothetical protein